MLGVKEFLTLRVCGCDPARVRLHCFLVFSARLASNPDAAPLLFDNFNGAAYKVE